MTESVKDPHALVVTAQSQMLDKLRLSEVRWAYLMFDNAVLGMLSKPTSTLNKIDHFTVVNLVPPPLGEREAEVDLVFIQTSFRLS